MHRAHAGKKHGHMVWVGVLGVIAGAVLLFCVPRLKAVSNVLFLFAGFHVAGAAVLLGSAYALGGNKFAVRFTSSRKRQEFDFGWAPAWTLGPWIAALVLLAGAGAISAAASQYWPASLACTLLAACFFAGGLFARSVSRIENAVLPMVDLVPNGHENPMILDAGCGSGRTTVALSRSVKQGTIVALDRFDADYIAGGGKALLTRNLQLAGLSGRVRIADGDITQLPFADQTFDAAVSGHAMDHLGALKPQGMREVLRVLKPGARFLLIVWVPGWTMFSIANVLSFALATPKAWRKLIAQTGFQISDEGMFNGYWFAVLQRPEA